MIHDLRVNSHGYPGFFEGPEEENIRKWDRILKRMEFLFREANMMDDVPEYAEISKKWLAAEGELREYRDRCLKQGMELMTKYFRNLWD